MNNNRIKNYRTTLCKINQFYDNIHKYKCNLQRKANKKTQQRQVINYVEYLNV